MPSGAMRQLWVEYSARIDKKIATFYDNHLKTQMTPVGDKPHSGWLLTMDGNNSVGGWASQPVSINNSQTAKGTPPRQAGVFGNRTVITVPPDNNNSVVLFVPPCSTINVEIKDRQVIVTTFSTLYMPTPMTPESGQILFDRGVATLAQNKGYSISEAAELADKGMQWARANFGSDYSHAERQFMGWINGAPERASNPSFQSISGANRPEPGSTINESPSAVQTSDKREEPTVFEEVEDIQVLNDPADVASAFEEPIYATVKRPSTAPAAVVSDGIISEDIESAPISGEDMNVTTDRPFTAPAALASVGEIAESVPASEDALAPASQRRASAPAAVPAERGTTATSASVESASVEEGASQQRPTTAPSSLDVHETVVSDSKRQVISDAEQTIKGQRSSLPDDYLDGVAELFAEPETAVANHNTVVSSEEPRIDQVASQDSSLSDDDLDGVAELFAEPETAVANHNTVVSSEEPRIDQVVSQDSSLSDDYLDGVAELFAEPETAVANHNTVVSSEEPRIDQVASQESSLSDDYLDGVAELFAEPETAVANNNTVASTDEPMTDQVASQDSSLSDDYLDGVAELFAEPEAAVDNRNTAIPTGSMVGDMVADNELAGVADETKVQEIMGVADGNVYEEDVNVGSKNETPQEIQQADAKMSTSATALESVVINDDIDSDYLADDEMESGQTDLGVAGVKIGEGTSASVTSESTEEVEDDGYFSDQVSAESESDVVPLDTTRIREIAQERKAALSDNQQQLDPAEAQYSTPAGFGRKIIDDPLDLSGVESSGYAKPNKLKMNFPIGSKDYQEMVQDRKLLGVSSTFNEMSVARGAYKKLQENDSNLALSKDIVAAAEKYISFDVIGSKPMLRQPDQVQLEALETLGLDEKASERAILLALIDQASNSLDVNKKTRHENRMKVLDKIHKTLFGKN